MWNFQVPVPRAQKKNGLKPEFVSLIIVGQSACDGSLKMQQSTLGNGLKKLLISTGLPRLVLLDTQI